MNKPAASDQLNTLISTYNNIFRMCYDALAADTPQDQREALRESIKEFLGPKVTNEKSNQI